MGRIFLITCSFLAISFPCFADKIIWSGEVKADGTPSNLIKLTLHKKYQIEVKGFVNLGKWIQNKEALANDACYEFNKETFTSKIEALRNSHNISVCDGKYHSDHVYYSEPFIAKQDRIHFWIYDSYYDDNSGVLTVQITELSNDKY